MATIYDEYLVNLFYWQQSYSVIQMSVCPLEAVGWKIVFKMPNNQQDVLSNEIKILLYYTNLQFKEINHSSMAWEVLYQKE